MRMREARDLIDDVRVDLGPVQDQLQSHPYVEAVEAGLVDLDRLRPLAGEQFAIVSSDLRSVAHLVSRLGDDFFLDLLVGERAALDALGPFATAVGMESADLVMYEPLPGAHAYAAYMAWLASFASGAEVASAYLLNFAAWGENCGRLSRALTGRYGLTGDQVRFFDRFAEPDPGFEDQALGLIASGLERGVPERLVRRTARLLQGYELLFWDTLLLELQR